MNQPASWCRADPGGVHGILRAHVGPVLGDRPLAAVAQARDDVLDLLTVRMGEGTAAGTCWAG